MIPNDKALKRRFHTLRTTTALTSPSKF